jgi:hypothetical protein
VRRYLSLPLILLAALGFWWIYSPSSDPAAQHSPPSHSETELHKPPTHRPTPPRPAAFPTTITLLPVAAATDSLHSTDTTSNDDLLLIHSLLRSHRRALGSNPVGLNDQITAALMGSNAKGAATLPKNHPAISENGELLDRWQTPYRFHALSGKLMEIRSAGPDRRFFTSDDALLRE